MRRQCHRDSWPAVEVHAVDTRPVGIAGEQRVVVRRAQEAEDPQLLDRLIEEFLGAGFVESAALQIALDVDVEADGTGKRKSQSVKHSPSDHVIRPSLSSFRFASTGRIRCTRFEWSRL